MIYKQDRRKNERESGFFLPASSVARRRRSEQVKAEFHHGFTPNHSAGSEPANQAKASQIEADGKSSGEVTQAP
jgi:hypothetical protein